MQQRQHEQACWGPEQPPLLLLLLLVLLLLLLHHRRVVVCVCLVCLTPAVAVCLKVAWQ
jgi:hypothetical protein